jgi:raffinose/stachyose/melibiose transport system permease protein
VSELVTAVPTVAAPASSPKPGRSTGKRSLSAKVVNYGLLVVVILIYLYPLAFLVNTALKSNGEFFSNPTGVVKAPHLSNFSTAWRQGNFASYVLNSALYTFVAAALGTAMSLMVAFPVSRGYLKYNRLWYVLFVSMLFLPNTLVTVFQLALRMHLYDTRLGYVLIMASGIGVGPLLIAGYLKSIPRELDEAAALDGVGYLRYLFRFLPPLIQPVLATVFILQAIGVWNDIILATILFTSQEHWPAPLGLFAFKGTYTSQWALLSAATMIVAAPLLIVYLFLQRYLVASVVGGAVKG